MSTERNRCIKFSDKYQYQQYEKIYCGSLPFQESFLEKVRSAHCSSMQLYTDADLRSGSRWEFKENPLCEGGKPLKATDAHKRKVLTVFHALSH